MSDVDQHIDRSSTDRKSLYTMWEDLEKRYGETVKHGWDNRMIRTLRTRQ